MDVVWFCILVVSGIGVVTGVCCVCTIAGSGVFFCSEIVGWGTVVFDGAWVVHPATSRKITSKINKIKNFFRINSAKRKRAIKVLLIFEMERKFL